VDHPARILLDDNDPQSRARAHTILAERAVGREDWPTAEAHLREAIDLDPTDERPKRLLATLLGREVKRGFGGWLRGKLGVWN
jgi:hypothetical protein